MAYDQIEFMKQVAEMYYYEEKNQAEIAREIHSSKPTVSRALKRAKEMGYIEINLQFPISYEDSLGEEIAGRYGLQQVCVVGTQYNSKELIIKELAPAFMKCIGGLVEDNSAIGLAWGRTLFTLSKYLGGEEKGKQGVKVVQVTGGVAQNNLSTNGEAILSNFARCFDADWFALPVPTIVENEIIAETLKKDSNVAKIIRMFDHLDALVFSLGEIRRDAIIVEAGYYSEEDFLNLKNQGVVGDLVGNFLQQDGTVFAEGINTSTMGIEASQIKEVANKMCIAIGEEKKAIIQAALKGGYVDYLFTDVVTAHALLD